MKRKVFWSEKLAGMVLIGILCVYFLCIAYLNFSETPSFYCTDMYADVCYAAEAWKSKSLFPPEWIFGNQLYVVATPVLAALLCGITGSPLTAMALASTIYGLLVIVTFLWMLKPAIEDLESRLLGAVVFLTIALIFGDPVESVNGWQLFFSMCSYYACYAVTAFLAFGCYLRSEKAHGTGYYLLLSLTCLLCFGTGMQSIRQTAIMVLPLMGTAFLQLLIQLYRREKCAFRSLAVAGLLSVGNLLGVICKHFLTVAQVFIYSKDYGQTTFSLFPHGMDTFLRCIKHIYSLLGPGTTQELVVLLVLFAAFLYELCHLYKRSAGQKDWATLKMLGLLGFSVLAIVATEMFVTMEVRDIYYFMLYPLLAFVVAKGYSYGRRFSRVVVLVLVFVLAAPSYNKLVSKCAQAYYREEDPYYMVSAYLQEKGYTTVYSGWNEGEKVAIASNLEIKAGFWNVESYVAVPYLCNRHVYDAESSQCVYLFKSEWRKEDGLARAQSRGYTLTPLKHFSNGDIDLYTAPVNLMECPQFE